MRPASARPRIGVVSAWASRANGGVFEAVVGHCEMLQHTGFEPVVFALADPNSKADRSRFGETEVVTLKITGPRTIGFAPGMLPAMLRANLDLLHLHGIWMYPTRAASDWAKKTGRPYVISPHGMLDPWIVSRGKFKKRIAKTLYERRSWRLASCFHALTEAEAVDIKVVTGRARSVVIANSVVAASGTKERGPILAYLGRIHPKKNVGGLIRAWREAADVLRPIDAQLRIAGWGDAEHVEALRAQIAEHPSDDIQFLGPTFEERKAELIGTARFLALPSYSEGLPMTVLEAWAAGTPTLISEHCHLPEAFAAGAAIDCGTEPASIAAVLRQSFAKSNAEWQIMSEAASSLSRDRFSPSAVAQRWHDTYMDLLAAAKT